MKKPLFIVVALAAIAVISAVVLFGSRGPSETASPEPVLGERIEITKVTSGGQELGRAFVSVPFLRSLPATAAIDVAVDINDDGSYSQEEIIAQGVPARAQAAWNNNFYFAASPPFDGSRNVRVTFGNEQKEVNATIGTYDVGELFDLASVTNPEEAMKGVPMDTAFGEPIEITQEGVPDIGQRPGECAPTAAANSLISLINQHGDEDQQPGNPQELIDALKGDMNWTPQNGVLPDDFVAGKNRWAARNGLPIRTEKVGDQHGVNTLDEIQEALEQGDAVELRLTFGNAAGQVVSGHMVTVTGIHIGEGQMYIDVNDPGSPEGTDIYEVQGNQITNYGYFDGLTVLSWGFVQTWEVSLTGTSLEPLTEEEIQGIEQFVGETRTIKVIVVNDKRVPISQVHVFAGEECDKEQHYHANKESVTALDGTVISDPDGCGYGKVKKVPVEDVPAP